MMMPVVSLRLAAPALSAALLALAASTASASASPSHHSSPSSHSSSGPSSHASGGTSSGSGGSSSSASPSSGASGASASTPTVSQVIVETLRNQATAGFDSATGGLWVNWTESTSGIVTGNYNGTGAPDTVVGSAARHDPATDLRYLHNLLSYASAHPSDTEFAGQIATYTAEVKKEFANTHDSRGWYYDELEAMAKLSGDPWFATTARGLVASYASHFDAQLGTIVITDSQYPTGFYRSDWALQEAAALVEAGTADGQPTWVSDGKAVFNFVRQHAYLPSAGIYLHALTGVVAAGGGASSTEVVARSSATGGNGGSLDPSELGQDAQSLLEGGQAAGDSSLVAQGEALLRTLSPSVNSLRLWDSSAGGFYENGAFTGNSTADPGAFAVETGKKDTDQLALLEAYHLADQLDASHPFTAVETALTQVAVAHLYEPAQHGFPYEWRSNWTAVSEGSGSVRTNEVWVTSEADGIALEALQSLGA
jgi:hypothetical protein